MISNQVRTAIIIYVISILVILLKKRDLIFDEQLRLIPFGFENNQSILSLPVIAVLLAIVAYYIVTRYDINLV